MWITTYISLYKLRLERRVCRRPGSRAKRDGTGADLTQTPQVPTM